jgi:hypothetical protein
LGEEMKELVIVQKVLRSLTMIFDPKISSLKEITYLYTLSVYNLHGILIAYEMRTEKENPITKEAMFKASNNTKKNKQKTKSKTSCSYIDDSID